MRKERERYGNKDAEALPGRERSHKHTEAEIGVTLPINQGMHIFPINTGS